MVSNEEVISYKAIHFHLTLFEKVINFIILQYSYHHRIIQQTGGEKRLHCQFTWQGGNDEEYITTAA